MKLKGLEKENKIYFIGIGGISMSSLAKFMSACGYSISGSDAVRNSETDSLAFYGVKTFHGQEDVRKELENCDAVVYTDAIPMENKEFCRAKELNKRMIVRGDLLGMICRHFQHVVAVAGSHGKTTCSSMCAHILKSCGVPFAAHIGGEDSAFGNFHFSGYEYFVTEACEYKKNLLKVHADVAILLNVDKDHMECYNGETDLINTFHEYLSKANVALVCGDDERCSRMGEFVTFGIKNILSDYRAVNLKMNGGSYSFHIEEYGKTLAHVRLKAVGQCNVYNALAAFAAMRSLGFHEAEIVRGLENFNGVKRRFEKIGNYRGVAFICDYAHHPREIASTLATAGMVCKGNLYVVFQPHTYSRTKLLMKEFSEVLCGIENLMIYKTYPARERFDEEGSAYTLSQAVGGLYAENIHVLNTWIRKTVKEGDAVLFLGAGDIYYVAQYLLQQLN